MRIDQIPLHLLQHKEEDHEYQRLHRIFYKDQEYAHPAAYERAEYRDQCGKCDHDPHKQCIRKLQHRHGDYEHTSQYDRLHTLPGEKA